MTRERRRMPLSRLRGNRAPAVMEEIGRPRMRAAQRVIKIG